MVYQLKWQHISQHRGSEVQTFQCWLGSMATPKNSCSALDLLDFQALAWSATVIPP